MSEVSEARPATSEVAGSPADPAADPGGPGPFRAFLRSSGSLWWREVIRFFRQKNRIAGALATPVVFWLILGSGFGNLPYLFGGTVVMIVLFAAIFSTISIIEDRNEGFLQGVLVSPAPRSAIVAGKLLGGTTVACVQAVVFLALAPLVDIWPSPASLAVLVLMALSLTGLGFLIAWHMDSTQGFHVIMNLVLMPMWVLSGAIFPLDGAPAWLGALMAANPLTYGVAAFRRTMVETGAQTGELPGMALSLGVTLAFGAITFWLACRAVMNRPRGDG